MAGQNESPEPLPLLGWKERIDFPEWGLARLRAKIDTGARTSALHAARYELSGSSNGAASVRVWLNLDPRRPDPLELVLPVVRMATVRSSTGLRECRPVVSALVRLGIVEIRIELTLTNRERMRYRIILGRLALAGRFWIDPGRTYRLPRPRRKRSRPGQTGGPPCGS